MLIPGTTFSDVPAPSVDWKQAYEKLRNNLQTLKTIADAEAKLFERHAGLDSPQAGISRDFAHRIQRILDGESLVEE